MSRKKILLVFGTRPEAIKMAPLFKEFQKYTEKFIVDVAVTAQHREMLDQVLSFFDIVPDYDLNIMKKGQDLFDVTARVLTGMRDVLDTSMPDYVFVHGDTTTSAASALSAFYRKIPVAHIEAGLRTNQVYSPWPEEMNRQITGRIASMHFAPTALSRSNLLKENVQDGSIWVTGNTVIDALTMVVKKISNNADIEKELTNILVDMGLPKDIIKNWNSTPGHSDSERRLILITGHRRENFGEGILNICKAIAELAFKYPAVDFVYPMHLNPNVREPIESVFGSQNIYENVFFIEPLEYLPFVYLMSRSYLVLTDSGGIQEEAPGLGKPVLVMRDTTERPEAISAGTVILVGTDSIKIVEEVSRLLENKEHYKRMSQANNPYGDGTACQKIVNVMLDEANKKMINNTMSKKSVI